jgi:hypothetical protein
VFWKHSARATEWWSKNFIVPVPREEHGVNPLVNFIPLLLARGAMQYVFVGVVCSSPISPLALFFLATSFCETAGKYFSFTWPQGQPDPPSQRCRNEVWGGYVLRARSLVPAPQVPFYHWDPKDSFIAPSCLITFQWISLFLKPVTVDLCYLWPKTQSLCR